MREAHDIPFKGWIPLNAFLWVAAGAAIWLALPYIIRPFI
jgi:hypothetical protein